MDNISKLKPRRGSINQWATLNPILDLGEMALEYPNEGISYGQCRIKIGDGETPWNDLPYAIDFSQATGVDGGTPATESSPLRFKSGTTAEWLTVDPVLAAGEPGYDTIIKELKIGDGLHKWSELRYVGQRWDTSLVYDFGNYDGGEV